MTGHPSDLEARLRAAIHAEADAADAQAGRAGRPGDDSLVAIRSRVRTVRRRRRALAVAAGIAVVATLAAVPRLGDHRGQVDTAGQGGSATTGLRPATSQPPGPSGGPATTGTVDTTPGGDASGPPSRTPSPGTTAKPNDPDMLGDGYLPLWPFATRADADAWRQAAATSGSQPWHLDAGQTALSFTTGFLGFTEIDKVVSHDVGPRDGHVTVGYTTPDGKTATAAVIHVMRYGDAANAPWEVVGTSDDQLVLETPNYATTGRSPMTVGGYVTGVDESLRVRVLQSSTGQLGQSTPLPAGGTHAAWQTTVDFDTAAATDPALTIVVSTGGHVQGVERFAITGVRS
jgi:hypothetical protein